MITLKGTVSGREKTSDKCNARCKGYTRAVLAVGAVVGRQAKNGEVKRGGAVSRSVQF